MRTIGAYDAKTHLPHLLDEVAEGATITKHGVPVARLVPPEAEKRRDVGEVIREFREFRNGIQPLEEVTIREMIDEGRRF